MGRAQRLAWASYLFLWFWSVPLLALDLVPPGGEAMASVMLILPGALAGWRLLERGGRPGRAAGWLVIGAILVGSWAVEHLGVTSGWPFGRYRYEGVLLPTLVGVVPLAIPFAWLLVVPGALELARLLLPRAPLPVLGLLGATLAMLLDMVIEPVAVYVNGYWTWLDAGPFYGIPTANFIAWWVVSALFCVLLLLYLRPAWRAEPQPALDLPAMLYLLNLALFTVVDLARGQPGAGLLGLALLGACLAVLRWRGHRLRAALPPLALLRRAAR
ncbi:MAG TPA: carotenoid biosynthesis protein [Herpetosiphonaceae bacterium]